MRFRPIAKDEAIAVHAAVIAKFGLFAISIDSIYARIVNRIDYSVTC